MLKFTNIASNTGCEKYNGRWLPVFLSARVGELSLSAIVEPATGVES